MCLDFPFSNGKMTVINIYACPASIPKLFCKNVEFRKALKEKVEESEFVVLGGDLNINLEYCDEHKCAFDYLKDIGLINCFDAYSTKKESWTKFPWQNDYIFIKTLKNAAKFRPRIYNEIPGSIAFVKEWSDHVPVEVIIDFD